MKFNREDKITASDAATDDNFGDSVAIDGDNAIVGASNSGKAYIYRYDGSSWNQISNVIPEDSDRDDNFGYSVAIDGNNFIVGAVADDDNGSNSGSAYIYSYDGNSWNQFTKITANDASFGNRFGNSVAIDGNNIIVGSHQDDDKGINSGSAYIYNYDGKDWNQVSKITANDADKFDSFGYSVAIDGNTAIVGAIEDDDNVSNSGSAYIYTYNGSSWNQATKLTAEDGGRDNNFGYSVAIDGNNAIVGAYKHSHNGINSGSAYIYNYNGSSWNQVSKLTANDAANNDNFGYSVAIDGDNAIVGAYEKGDRGTAYVYNYDGSIWKQVSKLTASDGEINDNFGYSVAISGDNAIVSSKGDDDNASNSGSAYIYSTAVLPSVNLSIDSNTGKEANTTQVTITASTRQPVNDAQTVDVAVAGGITAADYSLSNTTITIPKGATTGSVTFTVADDIAAEAAETAIFTISNPSSGIVLGTTTTANFTIEANDLVVTNTNDSGEGSLRQAITNANNFQGTDTVTFDASLNGKTIVLNSSELKITDAVNIQGLGADKLTISGDNTFRIFNIDDNNGNQPNVNVNVNGLTIQNGNSKDDGGAIWNRENLTLKNSVVRNNQAADDGGGIRNDGNLTIINSTIADNTSIGKTQTSGGGGVVNTIGASTTIINSTFSNNKAKNGGAIRNDGNLSLINSTLSGNIGSQAGGGLVNTVNPNNPAASGKATITNSTITKNTDGIANFGITNIDNSIIAENTNNNDILDLAAGKSNSSGNNLIGNGDRATNFTNGNNGDIVGTSSAPVNPLLDALRNNGGLTQTHALLSGSLAINAGNNNSIAQDTFDIDNDGNTTEKIPFEQRGVGFKRILDNTVDIGAYESKIAPGGVNNNLQLWLKADAGITQNGNAVSKWSDESGNQRHHNQTDISQQPSLTNDAINFNPAVTFDGVEDNLLATSVTFTQGTAFFIVNAEDATDSSTLLGTDKAALKYEQHNNKGKIGFTVFKFRDYTSDINTPFNQDAIIGYSKSSGDGIFNISVEKNGILSDSSIDTADKNQYIPVGILGSANNVDYLKGDIAEVIVYDKQLNTDDTQKVRSYLALKYGITLDSSINYINSSGNTIYDSQNNFNNYINDIAGIGKDNGSGLNQTQSRSVNSDSIVTISNASNLDNGEFLIWGNDNDDNGNIEEVSTDNGWNLDRIWCVAETGGNGVGKVDVSFDISQLTVKGTQTSDFALLKSSDDSFSSDVTSIAASSMNGNVIFNNVDFNNGDYFTLKTAALSTSIIQVSATTNNGSYKAGDTIAITVKFTDKVNINTGGTPQLTLETGTIDRNVNYISGSGTDTLTFIYTVQPGDKSTDLDYISNSALKLNGSTIKDNNGKSVDLSLPNPKNPNSLSANKNIIIDTQKPNAPSITGFTKDTDTLGDEITTDNTLIISGKAEANSNIEIYQDGIIGMTTADNLGKWIFDYTDTTLADNSYAFSAIALDAAGNISLKSQPLNITVDAINDAPILDNAGDTKLNAINEDDINNNGNLITDIISGGGEDKITDVNVNAVEGIAVTSVDNSNGSWQYSINGSTWNDFGTPNDTTARLLAADNLTKVRFLPNSNYEGTVINGITFRAWDTTTGNNGETADTTNNGGNTAFSSEIETAAITVNLINDAPKLENKTLTIDESGSVTLSSSNLSATDADNDDIDLVFTLTNLQNGSFEVNQVAQNSFTQQQINNGEVEFIHDGSENAPSYDIKVSDGDLTDSGSANISFTNINDAPTLKNDITKLTATEDTAFNFTLPFNTFADSDVGDILTYKATLDDDSQLPTWLTFTNDTFTGTPTNQDIGEIKIKVTATDKAGSAVSDTFTLKVENVNDAPIIDNAIFFIEENSEEETVIGIIPANDLDKEALNFALVSGNLDSDKDEKLALAINSNTGEITVNDKDDIDFETTPSFNLQVTATDAAGLSDSADITINLIDVAASKFDVNQSQNGIFVLDGGEKTNIKFTLSDVNASKVSEIAVFEVDENGNIDGLASDTDGYLKAALKQSQIIFSNLDNIPNGFNLENIQRIIEVDSNARLEFLMVSDGTVDNALTKLESTGKTNLPIFFSTSENLKVDNFNSQGFTLNWEDSKFGDRDFNDITLNAALTQEDPVKATKLQTKKELIDLRDITDNAAVNIEVYREADFDNLIGFYKIVDINGGIDIDNDGIADINVGDAGYKNAALANRITNLDLLATENQQTTTVDGNFEAGSILAPFIITNGTLDEAINNSAEVYFSFLSANSDKMDHIRLLGDNTFGFEDMNNGGDKDFNDVVVKIDF